MSAETKSVFTSDVAEHCRRLSALCDVLSQQLGLSAPQVALSLSTMLAAVIVEHYESSEHRNALDAISDMIEGELEDMLTNDAKEATHEPS